jgi:ABC-2 type transport system permease protein
MSTVAIAARPTTLSFHYFVNTYVRETKYEFLKMLRNRMYSFSVIGFPIMFYLLFGISMAHGRKEALDTARYLLAGYSCFGMVAASLFGIGVGLSNERANGWLDLKLASPMPPSAYIFAKVVSCMVFALMIVGLLVLIGITLGGVHMTPLEFLELSGITLCGAIPFSAMGLFIAAVVSPTAAPGVVNLIYLPMSFASGLWMPIEILPRWLQHIAPALPTYHYAQLALNIFGYARPGSMIVHWLALAGFTLALLAGAGLAFRSAAGRS